MDSSLTVFTRGSQNITLSTQQGLQPNSKAKDSQTRAPGVRSHSSGLQPYLTTYDPQPQSAKMHLSVVFLPFYNLIASITVFLNVPKHNRHQSVHDQPPRGPTGWGRPGLRAGNLYKCPQSVQMSPVRLIL